MSPLINTVHDYVPLTDAASDDLWETLTRSKFSSFSSSLPEINRWPSLGAMFFLSDLGYTIGASPINKPLATRDPARHNGRLVFCSAKYVETVGGSPFFDPETGEPFFLGTSPAYSPSYSRVVPLVFALRIDEGWDLLSEDDSFCDPQTDKAEPTGGLISWNGDLYLAIRLQNETGATLPNGNPELSPRAMKIYRHLSGTDWEDMTPTGLATGSGHTDFGHGSFFELEGSLHFVWEEAAGSTNRVAVAELEDGDWVRKGSATTLFPASTFSGISSNGDKAWISSGIETITYSPSAGFVPQMTWGNIFAFYSQWQPYSSRTNVLSRQVDGVGGLIFRRPENEASSYYIARNTSGTNWTITMHQHPMAGYGVVMKDWCWYGGKEYLLLYGSGPGMTSSEKGLWLYRKDGASWTLLGDGSARFYNDSGPFYDAKLVIIAGVAYVIHLERWTTNVVWFVIGKVRA